MRLIALFLLLASSLACAQLPGALLTPEQKAKLARQDEFRTAIVRRSMRIAGASDPVIYNTDGLFTGMTVGPLSWVLAQRNPLIAARLLARDKKLAPEDRYLPYFAGLLGEWDLALHALPHIKDVDAGDRAGVTPLMLAAQDGRADVVKALLARRAKVNATSAKSWPPLRRSASTRK